jgi:hypothetical protein
MCALIGVCIHLLLTPSPFHPPSLHPLASTSQGVYSQLHDIRTEVAKEPTPRGKWAAEVPDQVRNRDRVGTAAGAGDSTPPRAMQLA